MNASFSPPPLRSLDCGVNSDRLLYLSNDLPLSSSRSNRRRARNESYTSHGHSVSDGGILCSDSAPNCIPRALWTSNATAQNIDDSPVPGSRLQGSNFAYPTKKQASAKSASCPGGEGSHSHLVSGQTHPHRKWLFSLGNHSNSQSFGTSNAVYPVLLQNPISKCEPVTQVASTSCALTSYRQAIDEDEPHWTIYKSSMEYKFHKAIKELHMLEQSPEVSFGMSNVKVNIDNNDSPFDEEIFDTESSGLHSSDHIIKDQNCTICGMNLSRRPYSSKTILHGPDAPPVGVLSCSHIFHADCLEQVTPDDRVHDPPCPLCSNFNESVKGSPVDPIQMALRNSRKSKNKWIVSNNKPWRGGQMGATGRSLTRNLKQHFTSKEKGVKKPFPS